MSLNARNDDPETSHAAANAANNQRIRALVLSLYGDGPMTDEELTIRYFTHDGVAHKDSPRKRRSDLTRDGYLRDSGHRAMSSSNRSVIVWERSPYQASVDDADETE